MGILTLRRSSGKFLSETSAPMEKKMSRKSNEDGEISHFSHPQHPLVLVDVPYLFTCIGCKEFGAGKRFRCQRCDFDLHDFCALASPSIQNHPFHHKHQLLFFTKPGGRLRSGCDICSKPTKGYAFRCTTCKFEMHPCCASMLEEMNFPVHPHPLRLSSTIGAKNEDATFLCEVCGRKRNGQVYTCMICSYHLHAVCAKDMVNGLYLHGIKPPANKSKFGAAARIATHAFLGIIGDLIEGIGEGIGEALVDSIGRNGNNRTRSR